MYLASPDCCDFCSESPCGSTRRGSRTPALRVQLIQRCGLHDLSFSFLCLGPALTVSADTYNGGALRDRRVRFGNSPESVPKRPRGPAHRRDAAGELPKRFQPITTIPPGAVSSRPLLILSNDLCPPDDNYAFVSIGRRRIRRPVRILSEKQCSRRKS